MTSDIHFDVLNIAYPEHFIIKMRHSKGGLGWKISD